VFGAGGHGRVVAEVASQAGWPVVGFVDDALQPGKIAGTEIAVLGDRTWLTRGPRQRFKIVLGIGDNKARASAAGFLSSQSIPTATIISPFTVVSPSAKVGVGTVIMPGAVINSMAVLGEGVIVNTGAIVEHEAVVGNFAHLSPRSTLGGGAKVGDFSHIGIAATVLPLIQIGRCTILGAGSVATRAIADGIVAFGTPARAQRSIVSKD
jgi:UDP-N-acetylbacillosamine N-acetyltransferase